MKVVIKQGGKFRKGRHCLRCGMTRKDAKEISCWFGGGKWNNKHLWK